jgi:hypothetical protein
MIRDALTARGVPVAYLEFAGEGHAFRRAETIIRPKEAELEFYGKVYGFTSADATQPVVIANLPAGDLRCAGTPGNQSIALGRLRSTPGGDARPFLLEGETEGRAAGAVSPRHTRTRSGRGAPNVSNSGAMPAGGIDTERAAPLVP